jgi:hypothetical protein
MLIAARVDALGIAGLVVGVLGILLGIAGIAYARRRPRLVFYQEGQVVLVAKPEDELEVRWKGREVGAYSRTRIWVWNAGSATLDAAAKVSGYPLCFTWHGSPPTEILVLREILHTRGANGCRIDRAEGPGSIVLDFTYLDRNDGAVFEVEHTAASWKATASGTLKGTKTTLAEQMPKRYYSAVRWWIYLVLVAIPVALGIAALTSSHPKGDWIAAAVVSCVLVAVGGIEWLNQSRPAPPRGLRQARDSKLVDQRFDSSGQPLPK